MMIGVIYKYTSKDGKVYIGQTKNPVRRKCQHKNSKDSSYFHKAIQKYGFDYFTYEELFRAEFKDTSTLKSVLDKQEDYYINLYNSTDRNFGYNLRNGGTNGYSHSEETRRKISEGNKGKTLPEEQRKKISESLKGRKRPDLSQANSKTVYQYDKNYNLIQIWNSTKEAGENGYTQANISACCLGKRQTHKGFIWSYKLLN